MFIRYGAGKRIGAALMLCASMAEAQVTASWTNSAGGLWHVASNWSTNPIVPNNGSPAGTQYDVIIDLATANTYSATIAPVASPTGIQLNSIRLDSSTARIEQLSRSVSVGSLLLNSGTYLINAGTFSGRIAGSGGLFNVHGEPALDGVVLDRPIWIGGSNFGAAPRVHNGITLNNTSILPSGIGGALIFMSQPALLGSGTIDVPIGVNPGTLTIPSTIVLHHGAELSSTGATVINNGVFSLNNGVAASFSGSSVTTSRFYNDGLIDISNGSKAVLHFGFKNRAGLIRVQNGTVMFNHTLVDGMNWHVSDVGQLDLRENSYVDVYGKWQNAGNTISPTIFGNNVTLGGTFFGGIIDANSANWRTAQNMLADNVTLRGHLQVASPDANIGALYEVAGAGTLEQATLRLSGYNAKVQLLNGATLSGVGTIIANNPSPGSSNPGQIRSVNGGVIEAGIYVRAIGPGTCSVESTSANPLIFRGTFHADGGMMQFMGSRNEGTILASNGGRARITETLQQAGILEAGAGGTVEIYQLSRDVSSLGSLRNTGGVFHFAESTFLVGAGAVNIADTFGALAFSASRITGNGSLFGSGTILTIGTLNVDQTQIAVSHFSMRDRARVNFNAGAALKSATVRLGGAELYFNSTQGQELTTAGRIEFLANPGQFGVPELDNRIDATQGTLTIGSLTTVATVSGAGSLFGTPLINHGTISSSTTGHGILLSSQGLMVNHGTLEALNGGRLAIGGATGGFSNTTSFTNAGLIRIAGGSTATFAGTMTTAGIGAVQRELANGGGRVNLSGFINNSGATLNTATAFGEGSVALIAGSTISGGTIDTTGGPALYNDFATLTATSLVGEIQMAERGGLFIGSSLTMNNAIIRVPAPAADLISTLQPLSGTGTILGTGTIVMQGPGDGARLGAITTSMNIGPGIRVFVEHSGGSAANVRLRGTLTASAVGEIFTMYGRTTNDGTIMVRNGMRLTGSDTFANSASGLIRVEQNSMFRYDGGTFSNAGAIDLAGGAMVLDYPAAGPSVATSIRSQLAAGFAGGSWSGSGIRSTLAGADPEKRLAVGWSEAFEMFGDFPTQFLGESVDATALLLRNTLYGDANLDGTVDISDFGRLAASFNLAAGQRWSSGDFNYDGAVRLDDFAALARNYNLSAPEFERRAVPEPTGLFAGCIAGGLFVGRRRNPRSRG